MSDSATDRLPDPDSVTHLVPLHPLEEARSLYLRGALHILGILDAAPEAVFDDLAHLALELSGADGVEITFADGRRQVRKAVAGTVPAVVSPRTGSGPPGDLSLAVTMSSGMTVGQVVLHGGGSAQPDAGLRGALDRVARLVGAVLDERLSANWHDGGANAIGVVVVDSMGVLLSASPDLETTFGWRVDDMLGQSMMDLVHPEDLEEAAVAFERTGRALGLKAPYDCRLRRHDGSWAAVELTADNRLDDPDIGGIVYTVRGQHLRPRGEDMLAREAAILQLIARGESMEVIASAIAGVLDDLVENGMGCVMLVDQGGATLSPTGTASLPWGFRVALERMQIGPGTASCGIAAFQQQSRICPDVSVDSTWDQWRDDVKEHGIAACWSMPVVDAQDGNVVGTIAVYRTERGRPTFAESQIMDLCGNLTLTALDHTRAAAELMGRATHDSLTGLPNRDRFLEELRDVLAASEPGHGPTVFFLDLDRFKVINDSLGHEAGDQVLQSVAERLSGALRAPSMVARFGGDEFTCVVPEIDGAHALSRAQRLLSIFDEPLLVGGKEIFLNGSIGVALAGDEPIAPSELLQQADAALFRAKELGRGQVAIFDDEMHARALDRLAIEHGLRTALRSEELVVHFQPQFTMDGATFTGAEALVRWQHPQWGMVGPGRFIHIAEETGVIGPVTEVVLGEACRLIEQLAAVSGAVTVPVWVNLSASQLCHPTFVEMISRTLEEAGISGPQIGFEITEGAVMQDADTGVRNLHRMRDLGYKLGIDDFGTGYSSLSYLRRLPVDLLKLDQSFLVNLGQDAQHDAIVGTVFDLAHTLGMVALAEGVETVEQHERLKALGCDLVQGYLFARPGPPEAVLETFNRSVSPGLAGGPAGQRG